MREREGESRRQELGRYLEEGRLRDAVAGDLSEEAADLLIDAVSRYCDPRPAPRWKRRAGLLPARETGRQDQGR
jgi:hypothetical protein